MLCPATVEYHRLTNGLFTFGPQAAPGAPSDSPQLTAVQSCGLGLASNFVQQFGDPVADAGKLSSGLFAQDSWRLQPRLTLDFGVRYDAKKTDTLNPGFQSLQPVFAVLSLRRSPPVDRNNIQPRLGFAYQALLDGHLTVRGSYGMPCIWPFTSPT
jgi:outer membrane receptor protein involved in Fe transport